MAQMAKVAEMLRRTSPQAANLLEDTVEDLTFMHFPPGTDASSIRPTSLECINKKFTRRTRDVGNPSNYDV